MACLFALVVCAWWGQYGTNTLISAAVTWSENVSKERGNPAATHNLRDLLPGGHAPHETFGILLVLAGHCQIVGRCIGRHQRQRVRRACYLRQNGRHASFTKDAAARGEMDDGKGSTRYQQ